MRIIHFQTGGVLGIGANEGSGWHGLTQRDSGFPGTLPELIAKDADLLLRRLIAPGEKPIQRSPLGRAKRDMTVPRGKGPLDSGW